MGWLSEMSDLLPDLPADKLSCGMGTDNDFDSFFDENTNPVENCDQAKHVQRAGMPSCSAEAFNCLNSDGESTPKMRLPPKRRDIDAPAIGTPPAKKQRPPRRNGAAVERPRQFMHR